MASPSPYVVSYFTDDLDSSRFYGEVVGLELHSDLPDVYFLAGTGGWRLQILRTAPDRPGRQTVSSGLVLIGVQTKEELAALHSRLRGAGLNDTTVIATPTGGSSSCNYLTPRTHSTSDHLHGERSESTATSNTTRSSREARAERTLVCASCAPFVSLWRASGA